MHDDFDDDGEQLRAFFARAFAEESEEMETLRALYAEAGRPFGKTARALELWIEYALAGETWAVVN